MTILETLEDPAISQEWIFLLNSSANRRTSSANSRFAGLLGGKISPVKSWILQCFGYIRTGITIMMLAIGALLSNGTNLAWGESTRIVAIVNDDPITNIDIAMRTRLFLASSSELRTRLKKKLTENRTKMLWRKMLEEYQPQSRGEAMRLQAKLVKRLKNEVVNSLRHGMRKKILRELINERLQMQQANKLGVAMTDEELDDSLARIAARNKNRKTGKPLTREQFIASLKKMGIPIAEFKQRMKAKASWVRVIRRKFRYQVNIGDQDVDRMLSSKGNDKSPMQTVYNVQRVRLGLSGRDEKSKVRTLLLAEKLRKNVNSCKQLQKAVANISPVSIKKLISKPEGSFPHAIRAYLANTREGRLTPPAITSSGVELYAVCGKRKKHLIDASKREAVKNRLRQQEFAVLARRYLQDLRQEASIEYK